MLVTAVADPKATTGEVYRDGEQREGRGAKTLDRGCATAGVTANADLGEPVQVHRVACAPASRPPRLQAVCLVALASSGRRVGPIGAIRLGGEAV